MKTITRRTALKLLASTPAAAAMAWTPAEAEQAHEHVQESRRIAAARGVFDRLRLRTDNEAAARFYQALGFRRCTGEPNCTHRLELHE